jgi:hypothetical protein
VYFLAAVGVHALACRLPLPGNTVMKFLGVGGVLGLALVTHQLLAHGPTIESLATLALYAFACELYVFLFTLVHSSISAALLLALRSGPIPAAEVERRYGSADMVDSRIAKLIQNGFLRPDVAAGYALTPKGHKMLAVFKALGRFFRHTVEVKPAARHAGLQRSQAEPLGPRTGAPD